VDYILAYHNKKTHNKTFTGMFAVSSVKTLIRYYEVFKRRKTEGKHDLKIATIFSYTQNEDDADADGFIPEELPMAAEPELELRK
jgi:type I restriction enzyme R subunit